jgi:hypothetical protein
MKRDIKPDDVFFVLAATIGVAVICAFAISAMFDLIIYLIK